METVTVMYKGDRGSMVKYHLTPGGRVFNARGYVFGGNKRSNKMTRAEAELLTNPDGDSGVKSVVGNKEVSVKNREFVTVGNVGTLAEGDVFEIVGDKVAKKPAAKKKTEE